MSTILGVIVAGGEGKRFKPFVTNKTVFPFMGKPLLQHILENAIAAGLKKIIVVSNKDNEHFLRTFAPKGIQIISVLQEKPLGMSDALLSVKEHINGNPILILNGVDCIDSEIIKKVLQYSPEENLVMAAKEMQDYFPGGYLQFENNKAIGIIEKPAPGTEPSDLVKLVCDRIIDTDKLFKLLETITSTNDDIYEKALQKCMDIEPAAVIRYTGYWAKLKHPHFVLDVMELFLKYKIVQYISPTASISPHAYISGSVYIDDGAVINETAVIKGPAYIGKNVIIGQHTLIRNSLIEEGTVVGFGTEIARSYIGPSCNFHGNFIGDSVLEGEINPSYGTCTGNWRLFDNNHVVIKLADDRIKTNRIKLGAIIAKGVKCGINCMLMPGVVIGANSQIWPGAIVKGNIPADSKLIYSQEQELKV